MCRQAHENNDELAVRLAILKVLITARIRRPAIGGASVKMLEDCLGSKDGALIEIQLRHLQNKAFVEKGDHTSMITVEGVDYFIQHTHIDLLDRRMHARILKTLSLRRFDTTQTTSASGLELVIALKVQNIVEIEMALWYLREKGLIDIKDRGFVISEKGLDFLERLMDGDVTE